jgi:hypothetical protein
MWKWLNAHKLVEALQEEKDPGVQSEVLGSLEAVLASPFEPIGVDTHILPATLHEEELRIAWLPKGYILTFRPYVSGPIPHAGQNVVVRDLRYYSWLDSRPKGRPT